MADCPSGGRDQHDSRVYCPVCAVRNSEGFVRDYFRTPNGEPPPDWEWPSRQTDAPRCLCGHLHIGKCELCGCKEYRAAQTKEEDDNAAV